jgi:hypothetical protein
VCYWVNVIFYFSDAKVRKNNDICKYLGKYFCINREKKRKKRTGEDGRGSKRIGSNRCYRILKLENLKT